METWIAISESLTAADSARAARAEEIPARAVQVTRVEMGPLRASALVLGREQDRPYRTTIAGTGRSSCTCPSRQSPCKHAARVASLLAAAEQAARAETQELAEAEGAVAEAEAALESARLTLDGLRAARREHLLAAL